MVEADQIEDLEFKWCKKKGVGGKNKEIQFYESFRFDGVDYSLYDSVYLYKEGDPEPYIGKLVKLWENTNKTKKAKVLWFFRPCEIQNYLANEEVHENELFLASGEGAGLTNINPLEAIAGKCDVLCISTDERNRKPVEEELHMAEFVFGRTFDVGKLKISDKIEEKIAGIEAKLLLNRAAVYKFNGITKEILVNNDEGGKTTVARDGVTRIIKTVERRDATGKSKDAGISTIKESFDLPMVKGKSQLDKTNSRDVSALDGQTNTTLNDKIVLDGKVKKSQGFVDDGRPLKRPKLDKLSRKDDNDSSVTKTRIGNEENVQSLVANVDRMGKPSRQTIGVPKDKSKLPNNSERLDNDPCKPKVEGKSSLSNATYERSANPPIGDDTNHYKVIEVTCRPNLDKKTWFKKLPFEEGMESAFRQGTLVLLQNLNPLFTSSEVEDIMWHAFKEDCTAKMIQQTAISSRHSGRAFVIFKTREAAEKALRKLDEDCLLLSNGRPIVASPVDPSFINKQPTFHGHLVFNNIRQSSTRETKEAVSTSHCAQSNTIEYEMALEWCLLHDREDYAWDHLHKQHDGELRKLKSAFRGK